LKLFPLAHPAVSADAKLRSALGPGVYDQVGERTQRLSLYWFGAVWIHTFRRFFPLRFDCFAGSPKNFGFAGRAAEEEWYGFISVGRKAGCCLAESHLVAEKENESHGKANPAKCDDILLPSLQSALWAGNQPAMPESVPKFRVDDRVKACAAIKDASNKTRKLLAETHA
jgi:hypothetical protein